MYISRKIDLLLQDWKNQKNRKPLLLRGVRQCGKTSAVRKLAESFDNYVEINLEKQENLHSAFEGDIDCNRIITRFELETSTKITIGNTLVFIDEIQVCPRAITALRYFYEEMPDLHIIAAGSLLEFIFYSKNHSAAIDFPVGRIRSIFMYPFSFREFLIGCGQDLLCHYLDELKIGEEVNDAHEKLLDAYKQFLIVGGMPEAVSEYVQQKSLIACQQIHRDILLSFRDDFSKYDSEISAEIINYVFDFALHNVCRQVKASSAITNVSAYYFNECVKLLRRAGVIFPVKPSSCDSLPIGSGEKNTNMKLLFFDTGIYLTANGLDVGALLASEIFDDMNKGSVVEMQTGLELIKNANPYEEKDVHYWYQTGANAEVDYVIQKDLHIVPLEVKASNKGSMQSMQSYLKKHPSVPYGIRMSLENFSEYGNIKVYPVYAVGRL